MKRTPETTPTLGEFILAVVILLVIFVALFAAVTR